MTTKDKLSFMSLILNVGVVTGGRRDIDVLVISLLFRNPPSGN